MAFINETTSSMNDFVTKLHTFATANGWTDDQLDTGAGKMAVSKNPSGATKVFVSFRWDTASPNSLGIYNALAFDGVGTDPGNHTDDSGNGKVSSSEATLATGRRVGISNTPVQWWGFEDSNYLHFVVVRTDGFYIHGGFGQIDKIGDWTGGEYAYGYKHKTGVATNVAISPESTVLLDGLSAFSGIELFVATMHIEGLQGMPGANKWGVVVGAHSTFGTDRGSTARSKVVGGFRGGPMMVPFGRFGQDTSKGLQPMTPILNWFVDTPVTGDTHPLGWMKDTRLFNGEFWVAGDLVVVGGDTWQVFPSLAKGSSGALTNTSGHQFVAYKQVA